MDWACLLEKRGFPWGCVPISLLQLAAFQLFQLFQLILSGFISFDCPFSLLLYII